MKYKLFSSALLMLLFSISSVYAQPCRNSSAVIADSPYSPLSAEQIENAIDGTVKRSGYSKVAHPEAPDFSIDKDSGLLHFKNFSVDPLAMPEQDEIIALPRVIADLKIEKANLNRFNKFEYFIVQFSKGESASIRYQTLKQNIKIVGYLPDNAYIVAVPAGKYSSLSKFNGLRWGGKYPTAVKFEDNLLALLENHEIIPAEFLLQIGAFSTENLSGWEDIFTAAGAEVLNVSDIGPRRVMLRVPDYALMEVAALLANINGIEEARVFELPVLLNSGSIWLMQSGDPELKFTPLFDAGITGIGQIYAAADSGLDTDACQFRYSAFESAQTMAQEVRPPKVKVSDPINKTIAYYVMAGAEEYDETSGGFHGTMTCGCAAGDNYYNLASRETPGLDENDGMAPGAKIVFQDIGNKAGELMGLAMTTQYSLNQQAFGSGARVHNNSYGYSEPSVYYDSDSQALDTFLWANPDYTNVFAAGNSGPSAQTLGGEGSTAKNTVVVGASLPGWMSNGLDLINFSSCGPTSDGRIKPDIVAPGLIRSATEMQSKKVPGETNVYGSQAYESLTDPPNNQCGTATTAGTSFSAPTASGMVLLIRQYFTDGFYPSGLANEADAFIPSGALIKAVLVNSAHALEGAVVGFGYSGTHEVKDLTPPPSTQQGWGRITLDDGLYLRGDKLDLNVLADINNGSEDTLTEGGTAEYEIYSKADEPLKISLVWMDPAATSSSGRALVNDLNLKVTSPSGKVYAGNMNMVEGYSNQADTGNPQYDGINPLENVFIQSPERGVWKIEVIAESVPGNGQDDPWPSDQQGYALIATGNLGEGEDVLSPRLSFNSAEISGGCDNDEFLDKNETADITFNLRNSGDGTANSMHISFEVVADETAGSHLIDFPEGATWEISGMEPRSVYEITVPIRLAESDEDLCSTMARIHGIITDNDSNIIEDDIVNITLDADTSDDGMQTCNNSNCNLKPKLLKITPSKIEIGVETTIVLEGSTLLNDFTVTFDPDVISYEKIDYLNNGLAKIRNAVVDPSAQPGPVTVTITNPNGNLTISENLLETVEASEADGDSDDENANSEIDNESENGGSGSSGGCNSTTDSASLFLMLSIFALAIRRRIA